MKNLNTGSSRKFGQISYEDYINALQNYNVIKQASEKAKTLSDSTEKKLNSIKREINILKQKNKNNRDKYKEILDAEIKERERVWENTDGNFDFKINIKIESENESANADISNKKSKLEGEIKDVKSLIKEDKKKVEALTAEYEQLLKQQKSFANFSGKKAVPPDETALAFLEKALRKKLLTEYQENVVYQDVKTACESWLTGFAVFEKAERDFVNSEFYQKLQKARLSKVVIDKTAFTCQIVLSAVLAVITLVICGFSPNVFSFIVHTAVTTFAFGGLFATGLFFADTKYGFIKNIPLNEKVFKIIVFSLGCIIGAAVGLFLISPYRNLFVFGFGVLASLACGFLLNRTLKTRFAIRCMSKIEFLKNKERKRIFKKYESFDNGSYNFMIYCYLNHKAVEQYLSMHYVNKKRQEIQKNINQNRNDYKFFSEELENAQKKLKSLKSSSALDDYTRERLQKRDEKIKELENSRPKKPDFVALAKQRKEKELTELDNQLAENNKKIQQLSDTLPPLENEFGDKKSDSDELEQRFSKIENIIKSWDQTPLPISTNYRLNGTVCVNCDSIRIFNHKLKPTIFEYSSDRPTRYPITLIHELVFEYVKGLCLINPRRLLQINIFDYVSDPEIFYTSKYFKQIFTKGVIGGFYSMKDFEIRLISDNNGYKTFRNLVKAQTGEMGQLIKDNTDRIPQDAVKDIVLANQIINQNTDLFMYEVCIFIVPREFDPDVFDIPRGIIELIWRGSYIKYGILPVFFYDKQSVSPKWKMIIDDIQKVGNLFELN